MKRILTLLFLGGVTIALLLILLSARSTTPQGPRIAATIFPVASLAQTIAGDDAAVELVLDPGASPHTFELTPTKAARLSSVDAFFTIGYELDSWATASVDAEKTPIVDLSEGVSLICGEDVHVHHDDEEDHGDEDDEDEEHEEACDPHYWLDVQNAIVMTETITAELIALYPAYQEGFEERSATLISELERLHQDMIDAGNRDTTKDLVTVHESFSYFARAYGYSVRATVEPRPGQPPTPSELAELQETVQLYSIDTLYTEPQLSDQSLQAFVQDLNLAIMELDPLGGMAGRESYSSLMRYNAQTLLNN